MNNIRQSGFTLVELLVGVLLGALLLTAASTIYSAQARSYLWQQEIARLQEDARLLTEILRHDLLIAGGINLQADDADRPQVRISHKLSPRTRIQLLLGVEQGSVEVLGRWNVPGGNQVTRQITSPTNHFDYLQQDDCLRVDEQLYQRTNNNHAAVIQLQLHSGSCSNPIRNYLVDSQQQVLQVPDKDAPPSLVFDVSTGSLERVTASGQTQVWLNNLVASQLHFLTPAGGYVAASGLQDEDWTSVESIRVGVLLHSHSRLPGRDAAGSFQLLEAAPVVCPSGHLCIPYIMTFRMRNHGE